MWDLRDSPVNMGKWARAKQSLTLAAAHPSRTARGIFRLPLEQDAAARIAALPALELVELVPGGKNYDVTVGLQSARHSWSLGSSEQMILQILLRGRGCTKVFEIGTFNGGTTRLLAESLPDGGKVWTIDLPPTEYDATQDPAGFTGADVGAAYLLSPAAAKVHQLRGNSLEFDFSEFEGLMDLVLVDGGHEYANGFSDSLTALRLLRPGGVVVWDDFEPQWPGLVCGVCDAMGDHRLARLTKTPFAVYATL